MPNILIALALLVVLSVAVIILGVVIFRTARKRIEDPGGEESFTLSDLRRLHNQGQLTDAEFERAKAAMIARQRAATDRKTDRFQGRTSTNPDNGDAPADND